MRPLLLPLVPLYGAGVAIRNGLFDIGLLRSKKVNVPVISVGNLSAGGSGKTPLVELLARRLMQAGRKVAIISRGYKRQSTGTLVVSNGGVQCAEAAAAGDEPAQMASKLTGAVVVVDERRSRGAEYAIQKFGADVILLDDGFQHRYLKRDVDIVVIPVNEVEKPGSLLPAGNRREPVSSLRRASFIALSRCESLEDFSRANAILQKRVQKPVIGLTTKVSAFRRASSRFSVDLGGLKGKTAIAFSGIGTPQAFVRTVQALGLELKRHVVFPDHHAYEAGDLRSLETLMKDSGADYCITTEKDVARLSSPNDEVKRFIEQTPLFFVEIEQSVIAGEIVLHQIIDSL